MDEASREAKRQWKRAQRERLQARFPLRDAELRALFAALDEHLQGTPCEHTLAFTRAWLTAAGYDVFGVCEWLRSTGGHCDCEVAANSRDHWEDHR